MKIAGRLIRQSRARTVVAAFVGAVLLVVVLGSNYTVFSHAESEIHHLFRDASSINDDLDIRDHRFFAKEMMELGVMSQQDGRSDYAHRRTSKAASVIQELAAPEGHAAQENLTEPICTSENAILRVFMYDLPPEFHFGMMETKLELHNQIAWPDDASLIPRYPGGLYQQHSPAYWLTLDLMTFHRSNHCTAIRVMNPEEADIFFVPFFSSLSYNRYSRLGFKSKNDELQKKLISYLLRQNAWSRSGGKDHVIVMHHPNSLHIARERLGSAMFIVADFGRYSARVANVGKDIVAPYKHVIPTFEHDSSTFENRSTLLFFQGAIVRKEGGAIRQKLHNLIKNEQGVRFEEGNPKSQGFRSATAGMRSSKFCLHLAGDTPSSNRLFDAIASHCVPVIISEQIELPFEDELDYSQFCLFVRTSDALKRGFLVNLLRKMRKEEWTEMWKTLQQVGHHFEYRHPSQGDDAVEMIWKSIARRLPLIKQAVHKAHRYQRSQLVHSS